MSEVPDFTGPPEKEDRPPHHQRPIHQSEPHQEARTSTCNSSRFDDLAARGRRRAAAVRSAVISECSCFEILK